MGLENFARLCVQSSDARRALADTERPFRTIESVYGRGYRFRTVVESIDDEPGRGGQRPSRSRTALRSMAAAVSMLLVLAVGWWARPRVTEPSPAVVVAWSTSSTDESLRTVALAMAELTQFTLAEREDLMLVGPARNQTPDQLAAEPPLGATHALALRVEEGEVEGFTRLEAAWIEGLRTETPVPVSLTRHALPKIGHSASSLQRHVSVRDSVIDQVLDRAGLPMQRGQRQDALRPSDNEAFRLYLEAVAHWNVSCEDRATGSRLGRAVALDPGFAPAWYALAGSELVSANFCGRGEVHYDRAQRAARRAAELAPRWPDARLLVSSIDLYRGLTERVYSEQVELLEEFPRSVAMLLRASEVLRYAGFLGRAREHHERALELWPSAMAMTDWVPYPDLYDAKWNSFLAELAGRPSPYYRDYRGWALYQLGEKQRALDVLRPAFEQQPEDLFARLAKALARIVEGDSDAAAAELASMRELRGRTGSSDGEVTYKVAQLLALADRGDEALAVLDLSLKQGFFCPRCLEADPALAPLLTGPNGRRLASAIADRHRRFAERFSLVPELRGVASAL